MEIRASSMEIARGYVHGKVDFSLARHSMEAPDTTEVPENSTEKHWPVCASIKVIPRDFRQSLG